MTAAPGLIDQLRAEVRVDLAKFRADIEQIKRTSRSSSKEISGSFDDVGKSIANLSTPLRAFKSALAGVVAGIGVSTAVGLGRQALETADSIDKMSRQIGIGAEALQELRFAAKLNGIEQNTLDNALRKVTIRAAEAARGFGDARGVFDELSQVLGRQINLLAPTDKILADVADALDRIPSPADKARIAVKLFEEEGISLVNVLRGGSSALDGLRQQARDTGQVLSGDLVGDLVALKDEIDIVTNRISNNLSVAFGTLAKAINNLVDPSGISKAASVTQIQERLIQLGREEAAIQERLISLRKELSAEDFKGAEQAAKLELERIRALGEELEARKQRLLAGGTSGAVGSGGAAPIDQSAAKKAADDERRVIEAIHEERVRASQDSVQITAFEFAERLRLIQQFVKDSRAAERARLEAIEILSIETKRVERERLEEALKVDRERISEELKANRERVKEIERATAEVNERLAEQQLEHQRRIGEFSDRVADRILEGGRISFRGLAEAFEQEFLRRAIAGLASSGLTNIEGLLRGAAGGSGGGATLAAGLLKGAGVFAGFFAGGGRIPAGSFGIAGERGPEIISGPATVTPGLGGGTVINVYNASAERVDVIEAGSQGGKPLINVLIGQVNQAFARGSFDAALRSRFRLQPRTT